MLVKSDPSRHGLGRAKAAYCMGKTKGCWHSPNPLVDDRRQSVPSNAACPDRVISGHVRRNNQCPLLGG